MSRKVKKIGCALLCGVIMFALSACGSIGNNGNVEKCLELVNSPSTTLDNVWYNPGGVFRCAVFESLLISDADMIGMNKALASKYSVSEDGLTYSFELRSDVKWHDGEKFDAEDVVFSVKTALRCEDLNGIFTSAFLCIKGATEFCEGLSEELSGVTTEGRNVIFHLNRSTGDFLSVMAQFAILPEHLLGDVNPKQLSESDYWKKPVGCGCYKVTEAVEGEYFMLEANKDYYGKKPGIKNIRIRLNEEDCVRAMQEGRLDFYVTNDPEEIAILKGAENCNEYRLNILFPAYFIMNLSEDEGVNDYLKDVRVRKALILAIDRETIIDAIFPGSSVTDTLVPSWDTWYWQEAEKYDFNPEEAKKLLQEAEFDFSKPLRLRYSIKGQATKDLMETIAVYWRTVGIQVDLERFEGSGSEHMFEIRDFDVCYKRLSAFDYASIYEEVHGDGVMQTNLLGQPVYDELISKLGVTRVENDRKEIIRQMQMLDQEYLLRLPLFTLANIACVNSANFSMPNTYGNMWYRYNLCFEDWKLVR